MRYPLLFLFLFIFSSYVYGQVDARVQYSRLKSSENLIAISWSELEEERWKSKNQDRLDIMALKTELQSSSLPTSGLMATSYLISLQKPALIEILLEIDFISEGESIQIKDSESGKELFSTQHSEQKKILLPAFNPLTTNLIWTVTTANSYKSRFAIKSIYLHEYPKDRGSPVIGFGTALSCHPNAACKQDSVLKLISNSAIRIRMVMDEGIGWCTGAFINNAKNDKTPYVLLAYHCTFEFTPQYDLWRFDLEYKSDSCINPVSEPQVFSITGCERKAGGQASDFLLVLLDDDVPADRQVTFAGWNRDETVTPDTSYMIHHPNADIRKISTSTNKAVIHPNQIGWSEGYTTPGNHHFRFKFTEGGHQAGSSGAPIFNQDGFIVAQLHGGSMGCETANNAFMGRFSRSWSLGPTPGERLKDWLDPDDTGLVQLLSLPNLAEGDLADIHGTVLDPNGLPVRNVIITITGSVTDTVMTNAEGQFFLQAISRNGQYHIVPLKNDNQTNGLNVLDLISIQKHLLAKDTFDFPWQHIAADATNNNSVSVGDILVLLRLLLGKITFLPSSTSWRFDPPSIDINSVPVGVPLELQIRGIKIGDLNASADPGK